ncbi:MAG: SDR family oxidoreductase, partial [Desulfobacteraceae bacterium]|nr:SDR family oxidoreductase [Desulfobacteraceae bacterium]
MDLQLRDKVAVVTGGGRGIGEAIAMAFAKEGAQVAVADIEDDTAHAVSEKIKALGPKAFGIRSDVSNRDEVVSLMESVFKEFGRIDILVNNAGISPKKEGGAILTWEIEPEEWDMVMGVNLEGALFCSQQAVKYMLPQKRGAIVNISSLAGKAPREPMPTGAHYNVSKAGIISLTQKLGNELAPHGIRVNAVAPGRIATPMAKLATGPANQAMLDRTPMGRFGTPEEVANLVLFL